MPNNVVGLRDFVLFGGSSLSFPRITFHGTRASPSVLLYMLASEPAQVLAWTEETLRVLCYFFAHACLTSPLTNGDCGNWIFWSAHPGPAKREARLPSRTLDKVRSSRTDYTAREDRRGRRACFCCGGSVAMNSRRRDLRLSAHFGRFRLFGSTGSRALLGWTLSCVVAFLVGRLLSTTSSPRT